VVFVRLCVIVEAVLHFGEVLLELPNVLLDRFGLLFLHHDAVDESGDLIISTTEGELRQHRPHVYQERDSGRIEIAAAYKISGDSVGFEIGRYDRGLPLVIDPVLTYATYLGGSRTDSGTAVALDGAGNIYVAGDTFSPNFPVSSGAATAANQGGRDVFEPGTAVHSFRCGCN
jgi:hypothetical protein